MRRRARPGPRVPRPARFARVPAPKRRPQRVFSLPPSVRRLSQLREQDNPIRNNLPNMLTMANLSCGVLAILIASSSAGMRPAEMPAHAPRIYLSCLLIVLAAVLDRYDGKLARLLGAESEFGKQLDSLCDLISFGVAPAVISWQLHAALLFGPWRLIGYLGALLFPLAGAFRLARFNLTESNGVFQGVPITLAGSFLILFSLLETFALIRGRFRIGWPIVAGILVLSLSLLMVSRLRIPKK